MSTTLRNKCFRGALVTAALLLDLFCLSSHLAVARAHTVDPSFPITDAPVLASSIAGNTLFIGGAFTYVGRRTGNLVAMSKSNGAVFPSFPEVAGTIRALAPDGHGGWFVGGDFSSIGGVPRRHLAHILADGSIDSWHPDPDGPVLSLAVTAELLFVGGEFASLDGHPRTGLAAIDRSTNTVLPWAPQPNGKTYALCLRDETLFVGGTFTNLGGVARAYLAAIRLDTGETLAWDPHPNGPVRAIATAGSQVFFAGDFSEPRLALAAADVITGAITIWDPMVQSTVWALAVNHGSEVLVALEPTQPTEIVVGLYGQTFAAVDTVGGRALWTYAYNPDNDAAPNARGSVRTITVDDTTIVIGGMLSNPPYPRGFLVGMNAFTRSNLSWSPLVADEAVTATAIDANTIAVGGAFRQFGGRMRLGAAAIDVLTGDVAEWSANCDRPSFFGGYVPVELLHAGRANVYLGGDFTCIRDFQWGWAVLAQSGGARAWQPSVRPRNKPLAFLEHGGVLFVSGAFDLLEPAEWLLAFDAASGELLSWRPESDAGPWGALAANDSTLFAAGGGVPLSCDLVTGLRKPWSPNVYGSVYSMALDGERVLLGGAFNVPGSSPAKNFIAVSNSTGATESWGGVPDDAVRSITVTPEAVLIAGAFTSIDGVPRHRVAMFDKENGNLMDWAPELDGSVMTSAAHDSSVFIGGYFATVSGRDARFLARLGPADSLAPSVRVLSPNGNETAVIGDPMLLSWAANDNVGVQSVDLYVSRDGSDGPWELLAARIPNSGQFLWNVDGPDCFGGAFLRVVARDDAGTESSDVSDAGFSITTQPVPTRVELFQAERVPDGVLLEWSLSKSAEVSEVVVERAELEAREFMPVNGSITSHGDVMTVLDRDAATDRDLLYRLRARGVDGGIVLSETIIIPRVAGYGALELEAIAPTPANGRVTLRFTLPSQMMTELVLLDVQGRTTSVLARGSYDAGQHVVDLNPAGLRAGLYFVRLRAGGEVRVGRVVLAP